MNSCVYSNGYKFINRRQLTAAQTEQLKAVTDRASRIESEACWDSDLDLGRLHQDVLFLLSLINVSSVGGDL